MNAGYVIARENFKEASSHVSAESDPVMFNLLYGLQSLTNQIEADLTSLRAALGSLGNQPGRQATAKQKRRSGRTAATTRKSAKTVHRRGRR
jgi:hypothetical protein